MTTGDLETIEKCTEIIKEIFARNKVPEFETTFKNLWIGDLYKALFHLFQSIYRIKTYDVNDALKIAELNTAQIKSIETP